MKKSVLIIGLSIIAALGLTACGGSSKTIKMASGGTTGTYYAYSGVVAQALSEALNGSVKFSVHSSGASKANIFEIVDGSAEMAMVQNDIAYYAENGTDLFESDGVIEGFSALGGVYAEAVQIVAKKGITSVEQLKGKSVSIGDAGSGTEFNARQILEAYGLTTDDIKVQNLSFGASADALKDGKIDAFFCTAGAPTVAITDLSTTNDIEVLNISDEALKYLQDKYPFYTEFTLPKDSYKGVKDDTRMVAVKAMFIVSDKLDEDLVYNITKAIYEHPEKIAHDKAKELDVKTATSGITNKFHPGAEKYYKEAGVLK